MTSTRGLIRDNEMTDCDELLMKFVPVYGIRLFIFTLGTVLIL